MNGMSTIPQTNTVTVYVRHSADCPHKADPYYRGNRGKGCNCPKWLYTYNGSAAKRFSAKTRNWSTAEELAKQYRENPDFTPTEPKREEKSPAGRESVVAAVTIPEALNRWLKAGKGHSVGTLSAYTSFTRKFSRWADRRGLVNLNEVTANMLDEWRGSWTEDAEHDDDQIGASSQSTLLVRIKAFFDWATGIELLAKNPAKRLKRIRPDYAQTEVLTPEQFTVLLDSVEPFCAKQTGDIREFANELRALFLLQRVTGMRLIDCLTLPRTGINGDRLFTKTQKTGAEVKRRLPKCVIEALAVLSMDRPNFRPSHFLWGANLQQKTLSSSWGKMIAKMDAQFVNEEGKPFRFHSHCLRDTFAVELILADFKIEDVSKLLTHDSVLTTMKHYAPWIRRRESQLEVKLEKAIIEMGMNFA